MASAFIIVGKTSPVYELMMCGGREDLARQAHFLLHSALDMVELTVWANPATYLKVVDRHENQLVSAYVTPGGYRFMLLHESRNEEGIRAFFQEAHELLLKAALNPFHVPHGRIEAREFDGRIKGLARRYLGFKGE